MLLITRRAATGLLLVPLAGICSAEPAATARITFVLVNDIYLMSDQMVFDGESRGGFARLAAVVRAERTRGGPLIFA
jgi:5'-nucleotidase/UDP-sugar diphosphatase